MKRAAILALTLSAAVFAADYKDVNRTVALNGNGSVEIETHKGSIKVSTWVLETSWRAISTHSYNDIYANPLRMVVRLGRPFGQTRWTSAGCEPARS